MSNLYYESFLAHYGVRGQKWGVRRYQTSDGRWTHLGRKRNQVKDLKRSERDKTDRTKARLDAQKKKLAYEKSLGPSDHPTRDTIKAKVKESASNTVKKAKIEKAKYDLAIEESKKNKPSKEDVELANFLKSMGDVALNSAATSGTITKMTKDDMKKAWSSKITDIKEDVVDRVDNLRFR